MITDCRRRSLQEGMRKFRNGLKDGEMSFDVNKCHVLHIITRSQNFGYETNGIKLESVQCVKDLGTTIASSLKLCQNAKVPQVKLIEFLV